jgi:hypothetical protein
MNDDRDDLKRVGDRLHARLTSESPGNAADQICEQFLPLLAAALKRRFTNLNDPHLSETVAIDSILNYLARPARFDPAKASLIAYLYLDASRDLLNHINKPRVQSVPETTAVEMLITADGLEYNPEQRLIAEDSVLVRRMNSFVKHPVDKRLVDLMVEGVRETGEFAQALEVDHLTPAEQTVIVKQNKERGSCPTITGAAIQGKKLLVSGENFDTGAVVLLNGETKRPPTMRLTRLRR